MDKIIWSYWDQGLDEAPEIVKQSIRQWKKLHPDWEVNILNKYNIHDFISPLPIKESVLNRMTLAHKSDLLRVKLLAEYGGVWTDATCFPLKKMDDWLFENLNSGFFFFYKPGSDRIISNWFIAAEKNNLLLKKLYKNLISYWNNNSFINLGRKNTFFENQILRIVNRNRYLTLLWTTFFFKKIVRIYPYFIFHYMVFRIILNDNFLKSAFDKMPKILSKGPHLLQTEGQDSPLSQNIKKIIDNKIEPLFKLTWKIKLKKIQNNSNLAYLINKS